MTQHHEPTAPKLHGWEVRVQRVMDWITEHPREVLATLGGGLLVGILLAGFFEWSDRTEASAQVAFARVEREFLRAMGADPATGQLFAEPANPEQAKGAREAALAGFEALIVEHAGSRAAALSETRAAELELDLERADAALARLAAFTGSAAGDDPMRGVAYRLVAHIHEARGASLQAAEAYADGGRVETYPDRAWLWMAAGDNFDRAGESDRAIDAFQNALSIDAVLGERLRVVDRLTALESRAAAAKQEPAAEPAAEPATAPAAEPVVLELGRSAEEAAAAAESLEKALNAAAEAQDAASEPSDSAP